MILSKAKPGGTSSFLPHLTAFPSDPNSHGALLAWGLLSITLLCLLCPFALHPAPPPAALPHPFPLGRALDSFPSSILISFLTVCHQISPRTPLPSAPRKSPAEGAPQSLLSLYSCSSLEPAHSDCSPPATTLTRAQ